MQHTQTRYVLGIKQRLASCSSVNISTLDPLTSPGHALLTGGHQSSKQQHKRDVSESEEASDSEDSSGGESGSAGNGDAASEGDADLAHLQDDEVNKVFRAEVRLSVFT